MINEQQQTNAQDAVISDGRPPLTNQQVKSGASWFYWIAGLSIINTLIANFGGEMTFIVGLGITQFVDGLFMAIFGDAVGMARTIGMAVMVAFDLFFAGLFIFFGVKAAQGKRWAFLVGMFLYTLDSFIYFMVQDWFGFGFHVFALVMMFIGFRAIGKEMPQPQPTNLV